MQTNKINSLIIASNNKNKVKEIKEILGEYFGEIYSLKDKNIDIEIEENGNTFEENAIIKAKCISDLTGMIALADDSGLEVDALDGAPGIYSARYAGEPCDNEKNNQKLLLAMKNITNRNARFTSAIALYFPSGKVITALGHTYGSILPQKIGTNGFGYDPLFFSSELNKSFGVATSEEKNAVSHRAKALNNLKNLLDK